MSNRKKILARCVRCHMRAELCICSEIPALLVDTRLVVLMHKRESGKPTNTGRLAALALPGSEILVRGGAQDAPIDRDFHADGRQPLLLFPSDDAIELSAAYLDTLRRPFTLIVPDGTWRQASRVGTRVAGLSEVPRVKLAPGPATAYHLRRETRSGGLATMEAIARAMGILEGRQTQESLERIFTLMVERTMTSRGTPVPEAPRVKSPEYSESIGRAELIVRDRRLINREDPFDS